MADRCTAASSNTIFTVLTVLILAVAACRQDDPTPSDKLSATGAPGATNSQAVHLHTPPGADKNDDPKSPRALAKTGDVPDWVKTRPIRLAGSDRLSDLVSEPALLDSLKAGRLTSVASCRYNNLNTSAEVLFIQTPTSTDAFGLLSVLTPQGGRLHASDRSIRASHSDGASMRMVAQQGAICVCMDVAGRVEADSVQRSAQRLLDFIVFNLPASDSPILMQLLPNADTLWIVTQTASMRKLEHPLVRRLNPAAVATTLGLGSNAGLWIAAIPSSDKLPAHLIWMAEYTDKADATAAHARCLALTPENAGAMGLRLAVREPKATRLIGVWSEQAVDSDTLLKRLHEALP